MRYDIQWERISDCVDSKHGNGVVYAPEWGLSKFTYKYVYEDGYVEYLSIHIRGRKRIAKYGFLKNKEAAV